MEDPISGSITFHLQNTCLPGIFPCARLIIVWLRMNKVHTLPLSHFLLEEEGSLEMEGNNCLWGGGGKTCTIELR
jgi:hypothetical protein